MVHRQVCHVPGLRSAFLLIGGLITILPAHASAADLPEAAVEGQGGVRVVDSQMIWDASPHNAFTDLTRWKDRWYCSFREGTAHSSGDGTVRILSSHDGKKWQSAAHFVDKGQDLRDPKLCILPDGRLLVGVGASRIIRDDPELWETTSRVYITADGKTWDGPHTVGDPNVWMWRYVTHGDSVYSFGYAIAQSKRRNQLRKAFLKFYRSKNGIEWETITQTKAGGGYVNEAAFAFEPNDRCVVLLRREGGDSRLGMAEPPYTDWTWSDLKGQRFNGPALLRLPDGRLLAAGRSKALGAPSAKTVVGWLKTDPPELIPLLWLPSQHETGYPGLAFHEGRVWASYYSSQSGKCAIYIAELELIDNEEIPAAMQKNDTEESIPLLPWFENVLLETPPEKRKGGVIRWRTPRPTSNNKNECLNTAAASGGSRGPARPLRRTGSSAAR